ncbi:hypothetical protein PCASD_05398 [Puccinia coronata f. sp. avenae]|uniref:Ig-like domain-containing protein n=1 Tax=Puccinia coronata f. sp. avenae TaxID=200324 RepID=A0A2N5UVB8_9BASI|nr:hypothetical protein PCASD_05398 [Puccinia coronata f. sp. avenae]
MFFADSITSLLAILTLTSLVRLGASIQPQQCGMSIGGKNGLAAGYILCKNYGNVEYKCRVDNCHVGSMRDSPREHPLSTLYFQNCWRLPGPNNTPAAYAQTVNPSEYFVSREKGTITVTGNDLRSYVCAIKDNGARPWCNDCSLHNTHRE